MSQYAFDHRSAKRIARTVRRDEHRTTKPERIDRYRARRRRDVFGIITASTPIASTDNRWHYTVQIKTDTDANGAYITDGELLTEVLSENELQNTATHINGGQPLVLSSMTAPQILEVLPLANGTSVTLRKRGDHWYIIGRDNPTDFDCS